MLVVHFIRLEYDTENDWDMLVMKRLYPMDYRSVESERRELYWEVFEDEVLQLHKAGFVHRDIRRPSGIKGERYDNVFLTQRGLRLIDVGISALRPQVGDVLFSKYCEQELLEMQEFKEYFLSR